MRYGRKILICTAGALVVALGCANGRNAMKNDPTTGRDPRWARIDSLNDLGQYAGALALTEDVLAQARTAGDWRTEFRAWMYRARLQRYTGVEPKDVVQVLEARATETADVPLKQLLHSVIGQAYWDLYQEQRWQVLERTVGAGDPQDPDTWDQAMFMRTVIREYQASLEPYDTLAEIPVGELAPLLLPDGSGAKDTKLRPTVYDVLAQRALDIFRNSETRLTEPAWRFQLDDPRQFALFDAFTSRAFTHRDSSAWEWQALRLFQRLEQLHLSDTEPDALVDVTLDRLRFVRERSTLPDKDSLYTDALRTLRTRLPKNSCESEVIVALAQEHAEQAAKYQRLAGDAWKGEKKAAAELCREAIAKWPGSFGARNAEALLARLSMPTLNMEAPQAVTPDTPFPIALDYANVKQVWLRVVKDPLSINSEGAGDHGEWLAAQKAVRSWTVQVPDDGDLNEHRVELAVEGLPPGRYALLVSGSPDPVPHRDVIAYATCWSTRLSLLDRSQGTDLDLLVVDRVTGAPKTGVKATAYVRNADRAGIRRFIGVGEFVTDAEGLVRTDLKGQRGEVLWALKDGEDTYTSGSRWVYTYDEGVDTDTLRTFLFTDRAIYRPGQEVLFKGIVTARRRGTTVTKAGYRTTVTLTDVNGQEVAKADVTTDAYGAFHGTFTAPQGVLTGAMMLQEEHGSAGIHVEEYKRPTFEVAFDPVTTTPKLGEEAQVTGVAKSYAGVPLDGAQVRWTVKREARLPWWCGMWWRSIVPWGRSTEIASGTAATDASGAFRIAFLAQADPAIARAADPTFTYTVEAAVTDIAGETQSGDTRLSVGYRGIDIALDLGDALDRGTADSLHVGVQNLNGQPVDVPLDLTIAKLQAPARPFVPRPWERPDRFVLTREQHAAQLPDAPYADEDDPLTWPEQGIVLERKGWSAPGRALKLDGIRTWEPGSYRITVSAKDKDGNDVTARKVITVYDATAQRTGFVAEAFHVEAVKARVEPGGQALLLLSTALPETHVRMEVEREGGITDQRWITLGAAQQRIELPVQESDRGGFTVHLVCVERGQEHRQSLFIDVPWTNKELQVEWLSFRDKLLPGAKEEWRLRITGSKGEHVAAQLLAGMYDASLDRFVPHGWDLSIWPQRYARRAWVRAEPFGAGPAQQVWRHADVPGDTAHVYPVLNTFGYEGYGSRRWRLPMVQYMRADAAAPVVEEAESLDAQAEVGNMGLAGKAEQEKSSEGPEGQDASTSDGPQPVRTDFRETAFFFPDLLTDRDGAVVLRFTMPDALTRWKLLGLAHTTDLRTATFTKETITQKPLMVVPNLPRFLREGDRITLTAKINALEGGVSGRAKLELFDPFTNAAVGDRFGLREAVRPFTAAPGRSATAAWDITVPEGVGLVAARITAAGPGFSDGEERPLPVLTDKVLVTESLPLWTAIAGTKTFTLDKLRTNTSTTLRTQRLELQYTPNPAWYAVQALPYLMEYPHACAEQTFARLYANSLAAHIVAERPAVRQVFEQWKQAGPAAFASALEKNTELKSVVLQETPWVLDARDERGNKQRIALLFDLQRMATEQAAALNKLREMQLGNGAWPWWSGMRESRYITQHIVAGFGHLEKLGAADLRPDGRTQQMLRSAVHWLDAQAERDHKERLRTLKKEELEKYVPSAEEVHYLYARSFFPRWPIDGATHTAVDFLVQRLKGTWLESSLQQQAMIALALDRLGEKATAQLVVKSLGERATRSEELGMYWKGAGAGYDWWSFPTETHALLIEAFHDVANDAASVTALRTYLLRLKQTTDWKTTKATSEACYALLLTGDDWLGVEAAPVITVGGTRVEADQAEAGTGTFEHTWTAAEVKPAMGEVTITSTADRPSWGALHWQYLERMDRMTPHESPFRLRKQVLLKQATDSGPQLVALDEGRLLKAGDEIVIRIELRTDRYVDYVHLKDLRAAGLEPTETLSGYTYQGGLGYYRSIRDASVDFFFDRIAPGTYVLEHRLRVTHSGDFSNGITTAMCMYAPEFSAHSEGVRVVVK